jgi:acylphosphatase
MECVHIHVHGLVQGVFFRSNTQKTASALGLTGWVRNLKNGDVEILAQGPKEKLDALLKWCKQGPEHARVDELDINWEKVTDAYTAFRITH